MIAVIARRELRSLFFSPLAWTVLAVVQLLLAYFFLIYLERYDLLRPNLARLANPPGVTEIVIAPLFDTMSVILLLVSPILTMRLLSEEYRNQTLPLLFSAPVSMTEIVLGKYLGILCFNLIIICMIGLMPLSLYIGANIDGGMLLLCLIGVTLLMSSFTAVGLYISSLTNQPSIAAMGTFGALLLLWIIDAAATTGSTEGNVLSYLSVLKHYQSFLRGVFNSTDWIYYLLFSVTFLVLTIRRLDAHRLQD